jgi:hypothetical protein
MKVHDRTGFEITLSHASLSSCIKPPADLMNSSNPIFPIFPALFLSLLSDLNLSPTSSHHRCSVFQPTPLPGN